MSLGTVEIIEQNPAQPYLLGEYAAVVAVSELLEEEFTLKQAERLIRFAGSVSIEGAFEANQDPVVISSLHEAIDLASEGNETALKLLESNVETDLIERTIKAGIITDIELHDDEEGELWQHGQSVTQIHKNALVYASDHPHMRRRSEAETRNSYRLKSQYRQGKLKNRSFLTISRTPNMSADELARLRFFEDAPIVLQLATEIDGGIKLESAFISSKPDPDSPRQDEEIINQLGLVLGLDFSGKDDVELLDYPVLIDNDQIPDGLINIVKICDDIAGGTFYGESKPRQDYKVHKEESKKRIKEYKPKVQLIMGKLVASRKNIANPYDAVELLDSYADQEMVKLAVQDRRIDSRVFGSSAAPMIEQARMLREQGKEEESIAVTKKAQSVSESNSCPSGKLNERSRSNEDTSDNTSEESWHGGKRHYGAKCRCCGKRRTVVGACFICKSCVEQPLKMKSVFKKQEKDKKITKLSQVV